MVLCSERGGAMMGMEEITCPVHRAIVRQMHPVPAKRWRPSTDRERTEFVQEMKACADKGCKECGLGMRAERQRRKKT